MYIKYEHVDIAYDDHTVLQDVCFEADAGEFIYLIGKVGTGKSSLLKTFYGELDVHSGEATVLDFNLKKLKSKKLSALRKQLGIVFQDFQLLMDRNIWHNLDFVLKATGTKNKQERRKRIEEVLHQVGLEDKTDKMPYELSGGEQQRICIARAILNRPKIILADEATGNLDSENSQRAAELLHHISESGTTVIMSTHNESLINAFPGIVYRCTDGHVEECTEQYHARLKASDIQTESLETTNENN